MSEMTEILKRVEGLIISGSVEIDINNNSVSDMIAELRKAKTRFELTKSGIAVDFPSDKPLIRIYRIANIKADSKVSVSKETPIIKNPALKKSQHSYVPPMIAGDLVSVLQDEASHVVWLTGPTQCGKTTLVKYVAGKLNRKVFQINCRGDMGSEMFFGERTIEVDKVSNQNHIVFQKGLVEKAMVEGLDEQGNEVGEPAILFIDEAAAMPAHVAIGVNRLLESDDPRRTIVLAEDGGRMVKSHSKFRIIMAANTIGRGATSSEAAAYTAQMDALDISLLNRIAVTFRMGYDRDVEKHIVLEKVGNDKIAGLILKYRDAIRSHVKSGKLSSPFSTKRLVDISNMYRVFGDISKAVYYTVFEQLLPEEKAVYNEQAVAIFGKDLLQQFVQNNVDYI